MSEPGTQGAKGEAQDPATVNPLLLDAEGAISDQLYEVLKQVFARYATRPAKSTSDDDDKVCARSALNAFALDTNGQEMTDETYNEIVEYLDVTEAGELTIKGFIQLYQLQTENDASETEKDLRAWGYNPATLEREPSHEKGSDVPQGTKESEAVQGEAKEEPASK